MFEIIMGVIVFIAFTSIVFYGIYSEVKIMKLRAKADLDFKVNLLQSINEIKIELQYASGRRAVRKEDVIK